jgi:hypothetical protein
MSRVNDVVFIFNGGKKFSEEDLVQNDFNLELWFAKEKQLSYRRRILAQSRGASFGDMDDLIDKCIGIINDAFHKPFETIDRVCLLGRSEGCALALGLAAELNARGIKELTFVGVSDVPMWDEGRPKVRRVGTFKPINKPDSSGALGAPLLPGILSVSPVPQAEIPVVKLDTEIKARKKVNLYQTKGNHIRYSSAAARWMWWSHFSEGEVHGKLQNEGFEDRLRNDVTGDIPGGRFQTRDLNLHIDLNTGKHWKEMCTQAATDFANLPSQPLP